MENYNDEKILINKRSSGLLEKTVREWSELNDQDKGKILHFLDFKNEF